MVNAILGNCENLTYEKCSYSYKLKYIIYIWCIFLYILENVHKAIVKTTIVYGMLLSYLLLFIYL